MADWMITTESLNIVRESASLWPQIITAVSSAGAALGGVYMTHHFTRRREEKAAAAEHVRERVFIATELVFKLERFAESCLDVAVDDGEDNDDPQPVREPTVAYPDLIIDNVSGDWQVLPPRLMYLIRELPILANEARRAAENVKEDDFPGYHKEFFQERRYQYARLGLRAIFLVRRLRKMAGFPGTRLDGSYESTFQVLREVRTIGRKLRIKECKDEREWNT